MTDQEGNPVTVGYKGMLMVEVVNISSSGVVTWQGGYSGNTFNTPGGFTVDSHKGQNNWPGVPGG